MLQSSNEYLFGGILASTVGILFLLKSVNYLNIKKRNLGNKTAKGKRVDDDDVGNRGECGGFHDGPDVIIVGAGVAGSALAYTFGKINTELRSAFISAVDSGNIRTMQNRSMPAAPLPTPGALLLGDAFNMRHSLTAGGMTVALSDIVLLKNLLQPLHDLHDAASLCKYLEFFYTLRKPVACTINTLVGALYQVLGASPDKTRDVLRQACFDYLCLGGAYSTGPIALLSGLNPRPLSLVCHFFAVAIYGVGRLLLPFPSPKRVLIGARLISAAFSIIFPIMKAEGFRQTFFPASVPACYRAPPSK